MTTTPRTIQRSGVREGAAAAVAWLVRVWDALVANALVLAAWLALVAAASLMGSTHDEPKALFEPPAPPVVVDVVGRELYVTLPAAECHKLLWPQVDVGGDYEGFSYSCFTPAESLGATQGE